jgi:hypothetical protein
MRKGHMGSGRKGGGRQTTIVESKTLKGHLGLTPLDLPL